MPLESKIFKDTVDLIRNRYQKLSQDSSEKAFDGIAKFLAESQDQKDLNSILQDAARLVQRISGFNEIIIGIKSAKDGLFRHEIILGHTREAENMLRSMAYTRDQMRDCKDYPGIAIGKYTEFSLNETKPYVKGWEEKAYNRPLALEEPRKAPTKMIEGDYIDIYIFGEKNDMLGWIEISGPRDGNFPSRETMRWIELISIFLGVVLKRSDIESIRNSKIAETP